MRQKNTLIYFCLSQDLDLLLPVARTLKNRGQGVFALIDPLLYKESPRTRAALKDGGFRICVASPLSPRTLFYLLRSSALMTACDTTAGGHILGRRLTRLARFLGLRTFTVQHGFENIGLTYYDDEFPPHLVDFAAETIFTWGPLEGLDPRVPETIRRRCAAVGCPKQFDAKCLPDAPRPFPGQKLVVVLENLHWSRYGVKYQSSFLEDLEASAKNFPDAAFLVKPHHAGRWVTSRFKGRRPACGNLAIADPQDPAWEPYTAPALIKLADAVITTPSTTALDAACLGKKTAVAAYGMSLPRYAPLPLLQDFFDWKDFIARALKDNGGASLEALARDFARRACLPGDAAGRIADHLCPKT